MKKTAAIGALFALLLAGSLQLPAAAGKKPRRIPVLTTLYFHGDTDLGEIEAVEGITGGTFMSMDPTEPTATQSKSKHFGWSNTQCAGNRLFAVWLGELSGTVLGEIKVTFSSLSPPQSMDVRVWPDVFAQLCNAEYPSPAAEAKVDLPPGQATVEVFVPNGGFLVGDGLMVQISPTQIGTDTPGIGRIFYDSTAAPSKIEFMCLPDPGATSCTK